MTPTQPTQPATSKPAPARYSVSKGDWICGNAVTIYHGFYSGGGTDPDPAVRAQYRNNPATEGERDLGPIPAGRYTVKPAVEQGPGSTGSFVLALVPDTTTAARIKSLGRDPLNSFYLHGDNKSINFTASDGCIIAPRAARTSINNLVLKGEDQLDVVA